MSLYTPKMLNEKDRKSLPSPVSVYIKYTLPGLGLNYPKNKKTPWIGLITITNESAHSQ